MEALAEYVRKRLETVESLLEQLGEVSPLAHIKNESVRKKFSDTWHDAVGDTSAIRGILLYIQKGYPWRKQFSL